MWQNVLLLFITLAFFSRLTFKDNRIEAPKEFVATSLEGQEVLSGADAAAAPAFVSFALRFDSELDPQVL